MFRKIGQVIKIAFLVKENRKCIILTLFFEIILSNMSLNHGRELIKRIGIYPEWNAFSLIWNDTFFLMLFFFAVIFAFSSAPFQKKSSSFIMIRSGKKLYIIAHIIYIGILSLVIPIFLYMVNTLFLPYKKNNGDWGQFWGAIAQNPQSYSDLNYISVDYRVLWDFTPQESLCHIFGICFLLCFMSGLVIYLTSLHKKKKIGIIIIVALVSMSRISVFLHLVRLYWVNPFTWICLNILTPVKNGVFITVFYAKAMLCLINGILIIGIMVTASKKRTCYES